MRKISPMISASVSKIPKPVLTGASVATFVFVILWFVQQNNINSLEQKIGKLSARIVQASSIDERLKLEKDILGFEKDKTIIQNGAYTNLVQALGGLVLSMTAWVGYQNFRIGEKNLRIGEKNLKVSEDKQVTERFSKSIEHLGSDKIDVRLGGIYALEQIAIDSAKYHWTIVEILSAFVREKCPLNNVAPPDSNLEKTLLDEQSEQQTSVSTHKKVGVDIQAAMTVLGRRKVAQDPPDKSIDLRNVSLPFIEIQESNLSKANLIRANLSGANLSKANLIEANLSGTCLIRANLIEANLSGTCLIRANLIEANLIRANLIRANLIEANLIEACLIRANLSKANLRRADLSNTRFGDNLGISDDLKKELEGKGAIFEDSPSI